MNNPLAVKALGTVLAYQCNSRLNLLRAISAALEYQQLFEIKHEIDKLITEEELAESQHTHMLFTETSMFEKKRNLAGK